MKHYHPEDSVVCSVIAIVCTLLSQTCMGHEECVHMAITKSATESSASLTAFLTDNFGASCAPFESVPLLRLSHGPIGWMVQGSFNEDDRPRSIKHFYTVRPQRPPVAGLTDAIPYAETDSFTWGAIRGGGGPIEKQPWSWQNARDYAYAALTSPLESQRFDNFADLFFALGHVLHLCQDLAQPDHVRNDAHPIKKLRWIENHGAANYEKKKGIWLQPHPHGWPYWRSKGFTKLQDFWDRGKYKGDDEQLIAALDKDKTADGDEKLGLAEFCNGNFLGEDATYAEHFTPGDQHYFPFPRVRRMQSFKDYQGNLPANVRMTFVRNGDSVYRIPIKKDKDGPTVNAHSMLLYLGTMPQFDAYTRPVAYVSSTINESAVLDEYHSILIPKAVEYSAGILDYFFRGKLEASAVMRSDGKYVVTIVNRSGDKLKGGEFKVYWDNATTGTRTPLSGSDFAMTWSESDTLANDGSRTAVLTAQPNVANYILVYKGTIGFDGSAALDSVDANIAVAMRPFSLPCGGSGKMVKDLAWDSYIAKWGQNHEVAASMAGGDGSVTINAAGTYPSACEGAVWVYFYTPGICNAGPPLDAAVTVQVSGVLGQDTRCGYNSKARAEIEVNFKNNTGFASWKLNGYDGMSPVSYEHTVTATGRIGTGQSWAPTIQLWCDYSTMNATITIRPLTIP